MANFLIDFYKISQPAAPRTQDSADEQRRYRKLSLQTFTAATLGYSFYYVCRTSLSVMKKTMLDDGMFDASQLGIIGSALLFTYAVGKFVNGFVCDHCNIRRFMATGLLLSALANAVMGFTGVVSGAGSSLLTALFIVCAVMWGLNGWAQSMGAPASIVSLSRWFPLNRRGTYYGFFSASHNIGEFLSFIFVGQIVAVAGWQWGFFGATLAGIGGVIIVLCWMHDTPESCGLPPVEVLAHEQKHDSQHSTKELQRQVLRMPAVWILAAASAFMYIARYSLNSWGVLFLQEVKGFDTVDATFIISINALLGILGTVCSGWLSDVLFKGNRNVPALLAGILLTVSYVMFIYGGNSWFINILSMVLFGISVGVLICFLGGLMAVDIVPRRASGAALGIVGIASYVAAGIQDVVSGTLIDRNLTVVVNELGETVRHYDFHQVALCWIGASVISFLLPVLNWKRKKTTD